MKNEIISPRQFFILTMLFIIGSSILIVSGPVVSQSKQSGWISASISVFLGVLLIFSYNSLFKMYPTLTFVELSEKILGKWLGKTISFIYFTFIFLLSSLVLNNIGTFMGTQILIATPIYFTSLIFMLAVALGVSMGLEAIARTAEIFIPWVFLLFLILLGSNIPNYEVEHLLPIREVGIKAIIRGAIPLFSIPYLELITLFMVIPYVNDHVKARRTFWLAGVFGGLLLITIILITLLVYGVYVTQSQLYPTYILGKKIHLGEFLNRIEVVVAVLWIMSIYFKLVILFFACTRSFVQIFHLKKEKSFIMPLAMVVLFLSIHVYPNTASFLEFAGDTWPAYAFTHGFIIPFGLWVIAKLRNRSQNPYSTKM